MNIPIQNPIFFHIGYHRTGTTFLQRDIFPQCREKIILALNNNQLDCLIKYFAYNEDRKITEMELYSELKKKIGDDIEIPIVASSERYSGTYWEDSFDISKKIKKSFDNANIIICIRKQQTVIPSLYSNYLKGGGTESYSTYVQKVIENNKFDYEKLITHYRDLFNTESVLVLVYEDLKKNREHFIGQLLDFIGIRNSVEIKYNDIIRNKRNSVLEQRLHYILNRLAPHSDGSFSKLYEVFSDLSRKCASRIDQMQLVKLTPFEQHIKCNQMISAHYADSNQKVFDLLQRENIYSD
jgi:hypothetical protein